MKKIFLISIILICKVANNIYSQEVSIDETFGENGFTKMPYSAVQHIDFDKDGNIFTFGWAAASPAILKTDANGNIDSNFGTDGTIVLDEYWSNMGTNHAIKVTKDNKILVVLTVNRHGANPAYNLFKQVILRFNSDGTVDETFGDNGEIIVENPNSSIRLVNTENDDFMLLAYYDNNVKKIYISKYDYNFEIDMNFGTNGKAYLTSNLLGRFFPNSMIILNDNSIVLAGSEESGSPIKLAFCKLNPNGNFATDFANDGVFVTNISNNSYSKLFTNIIETTDGNLLFTGIYIDDPVVTFRHFVYGFNSNGTINNNFGVNGFFIYDTPNSNSRPTVLLVGNKILIGKDNEIICINTNGTLDTDFGNNGSFVFEDFFIGDIKQQTSDKFIVGGGAGWDGNGEVLVRLNIPFDVSIQKTPENIFTVSPNPAQDKLTIHHSKEIGNIGLYDLSGRLIRSKDALQCVFTVLDISDLDSGIYFITVDGKTVKFIKE